MGNANSGNRHHPPSASQPDPDKPVSDKPVSRSYQTFALTIGIDTYRSETFRSESLQGAVNDANKFDEYLRKDRGTPEENIISLRDEKATRSAIIDGFKRLESDERIVSGTAAIIIYYAGHGAIAHKPVEWKDWETPGDEIELLCPSDIGLRDQNDKIIDGIPDRTISQLLLDLSAAKGNNITLILDCCHAAGINRGGGGARGPIDLGVGQLVDVRPRNFRSVHDLSPGCDEDIYRRGSSLSRSLRDSHVLLAACRRGQTASEINGIGLFTDALLRCMRDKPLAGVLTYASLLHHLDIPETQTPQFDGKHIRRHLFDSWESPADSSMILCRRKELQDPDRLVLRLEAGALHGITPGSTFAIHETDVSHPNNELPTAVVTTVEPFCSHLVLHDEAFFTTYQDHPVWYAQLKEASGSNLAIHCNSSDLFNHILAEDSEPKLTVPAIAAERQSEADLCLTMKDNSVFFDRGDKNGTISASMDFPSRFPARPVAVKDIARIRRVIDRYAQFSSHLSRPGSVPISQYGISIKMHELKLDKGSLSPTGDSILPDGEGKPVELVIDSSSRKKYYGFTIHNESELALYAYLFYFDASTLEIEEWYCPIQGNSKQNTAIDTCLQGNSTLTLGFGSGGMQKVEFSVPDGQDVDVCFFKIFVTTKAVDLASISQPSPFNEMIGRGAKRVPPSITDDWASTTIPVVLRRTQTSKSPAVPPSIACSERESTKPAEDYMQGLGKWLIASWQRVERFLQSRVPQPYAVPNEVLL
ncbi:caspase domain-containing protein [Desarmillaria tabescens]|uniref:Caspase domain-containing protein n=1 Tax=Armillaria tabescens TaxID=1929756 RepID=A0AA39NP63_ARMTA|nr:caspase domain-containing protein [Desarmillaria tabescens]KAK0469284.1 caspase domain-containing protein [Desarmillaria tabescens]